LVQKINEFSAIGAGEHFALTAMYLDKTPEDAVKIANELCVWCSDPINVILPKTLRRVRLLRNKE